MIALLYRSLATLGGPLIEAWLDRRRRRGKEDPARMAERRGQASLPRPAGRVLWVHGASVGEALSVLPLLDRLLGQCPDWSVVLTTGTVTSAQLLAERLPAQPGLSRVVHQFVPVDRPAWVERFLAHWQPDAALWLESEFWPNLLAAARRRGVPMVLLNGRVSVRSFRRWSGVRGFIAPMLGGFRLCLGQTDGDAQRLAALGAPATACVGNLKFAAPPLPAAPAALTALQQAVGARPCWLAASTHAGEEAVAAAVHAALRPRFPDLLTLIVPRHPERGAAIAAAIGAERRAPTGHPPQAGTGLYVADTLGELGLFYRVAPITFIGKSLVGQGGQNPLEPARLGSAVLMGPHMQNFPDIAPRLLACGGARQVADVDALTAAVADLLADPAARAEMARAGQAFASAEADVLDRVLALLVPMLQEAAAR